MGQVSITLDSSGRLVVRFPYEKRVISALKAIPGHRWEPAAKVWTFPRTPEVIASLRRIFAGRQVDIEPSSSTEPEGRRSFARRSTRLAGFDYSAPGGYFITMCVRDRACVFGGISNGRVVLSEMGEIVDACWRGIPRHFRNVHLGSYVVMPDHFHGIVEILKHPCRGVQLNAPTGLPPFAAISPPAGSLGVIIRTFKAAVTTRLRARGWYRDGTVWQRGFHDRVIRDEAEWFLVERYIESNPLSWQNDTEGGENIDQLPGIITPNRGW